MIQNEKDLEDFLIAELNLVSPQFELERLPGGKISGSIISDSFNGMSDSQRQKEIWDALEKDLGNEATRKVGTLLAYTNTEWNVDFAENN